jgi:mannose-6-phosphate isomerase-like protein (cupin superfamily)
VIENPRTGEQVEFVSETADLLVMDVTWPRKGRRALAHVHAEMEETWHVLEGTAQFTIGEVDHVLGPGDAVTAPPGTRHLAWNPADEPVRLRIEMRPPLRWREFTTRFFAGDDPIELLDEFAAEVHL